ncbi:MAG: alanine racemase, partial [Candidatus Edwardsbacteria bacterium]|nr:alanine racemase [Candidatus Edwardsbacteria bacterium]
VLPVGYNEGYDRKLSNTAHVLVRGKRAPIRGRVCMNLCMADVTDIPGVKLEDEVVLLGRQGKEHVSAEQLAAWIGTINYEAVTRINPLLQRVVV